MSWAQYLDLSWYERYVMNDELINRIQDHNAESSERPKDDRK